MGLWKRMARNRPIRPARQPCSSVAFITIGLIGVIMLFSMKFAEMAVPEISFPMQQYEWWFGFFGFLVVFYVGT